MTETHILECSERGSAAGKTEPPAGLCFGPEETWGKSPCGPSGGGRQAECQEVPPSCHGLARDSRGACFLSCMDGGPHLLLRCVDLKDSRGRVRGRLIHASSPALGLDLGPGGPCVLWNLGWGSGCRGRLCSPPHHWGRARP